MSRQFIEQRLSVLQVGGVEALGEPAEDRGQQLVCVGAPTLLLPQPAQAYCRPQLERFGLLPASDVEGLAEPGFRLGLSTRLAGPLALGSVYHRQFRSWTPRHTPACLLSQQ